MRLLRNMCWDEVAISLLFVNAKNSTILFEMRCISNISEI